MTRDHCFARIILDNTVAVDPTTQRPVLQWDQAIKRPAVRNMTATQLRGAIELGKRIVEGSVDLVGLDRLSLEVRGKKGKGPDHDAQDGT